jgi:hypothetical protein
MDMYSHYVLTIYPVIVRAYLDGSKVQWPFPLRQIQKTVLPRGSLPGPNCKLDNSSALYQIQNTQTLVSLRECAAGVMTTSPAART